MGGYPSYHLQGIALHVMQAVQKGGGSPPKPYPKGFSLNGR